MPQPNRPDPSPLPPIARRRCPKCGLQLFLSHMEPAECDGYEDRIYKCSVCSFDETVTVKFRCREDEWIKISDAQFQIVMDAAAHLAPKKRNLFLHRVEVQLRFAYRGNLSDEELRMAVTTAMQGLRH